MTSTIDTLMDPNTIRLRYCHDCYVSMVGRGDARCWSCTGPLNPSMPRGWVF